MKGTKAIILALACMGISLGCIKAPLKVESLKQKIRYEEEKGSSQGDISLSGEQEVSVSDWNRRIYQVEYSLTAGSADEASVKGYAGKHFHMVDSQGNILSEGAYIDAQGNSAASGGRVSRDINGWYILWEDTDLASWGTHTFYVQSDSDYVGGNNQLIGLEGLSGVYLKESSGSADFPMNTSSVNVAVEVEALDQVFPVMAGMDMANQELAEKAVVKLNCIYGNLQDVPLKAQWYALIDGGEIPVGEQLTRAPYTLPANEVATMADTKAYRLKLYYNGEASTDESRANSGGQENSISEDVPMAEAVLSNEVLRGCISVSVQLEQLPYKDGLDFHVFRFRLYRFDSQNQVISDDTPYTEYSVAFETNGDQARKEIEIGGLTDGWYSLVAENPEGHYAENTDQRTDNCLPYSRTGNSAGIDFHIGAVVDNQYSWEVIRYQGQDMSDPLGDNFFKIVYNYRETVYPVNYRSNVPEGAVLYGQEPSDLGKYPAGDAVSVQGSNGMTSEGWQFVGWSTEAGDGIYKSGESLYSDNSVHNIAVEGSVPMADGGLTLYGRWVKTYAVNYNGNTNTGGDLPQDNSGSVNVGSNLYYSGDEVIVREPGNLVKRDDDGTQYVFDGWSLNQDGSGNRLNAGAHVKVKDADLNFYAQWKAVSADKYAVNYIAALPKDTVMTGVLPQDTEKYQEGAMVTAKNQGTIAVEHYRFAGWALTSREDAIYQSGEELYGTKDIGKTVTKAEASMKENGLYFYSRWIPLYQVIYKANTGAVEGLLEDKNEYEENAMVEVLDGEKMIREGYRFMGWNTESDGSGQNYDSGLKFNMVSENITLYAQWEKIPEPETEAKDSDLNVPHRGTWPIVILAIVGVVCIMAYVLYQWLTHRKG